MRRTITRCTMAALAALGLLAAGCGSDKPGGTPGDAPEAKPTSAPVDTSTVKATAPATAAAAPETTTAAAATSAVAATTPAVAMTTVAAAAPASTAAAAAAPATSGSAAAGAKTFDCGAKGQKPCPMQGWMKSVMAGASSSGDGAKLAEALSYVAARPPPGFATWASIASGGATKAKGGDIEGAKAVCKTCHDTYKEKYKTTMRDRAF